MHAHRLTAATLAVAALLSGACGGSTTAGRDTSATASTLPSLDARAQPSPPADTTPPAEASVLPDLVVDDVASGTKVNLASLVPSPEPLLVWFWAPH